MVTVNSTTFLVATLLVLTGTLTLRKSPCGEGAYLVGIVANAFGAFAFLAGFIILIGTWMAKLDSEFVNKHFGTSYTTEDFFFHREDIKAMHIGNRIRIKVEDGTSTTSQPGK
jgi:hypothetical protein